MLVPHDGDPVIVKILKKIDGLKETMKDYLETLDISEVDIINYLVEKKNANLLSQDDHEELELLREVF